MSTTNGTTARTIRTITAKSGTLLPATIAPQTDINLMVTAIAMYHRFNERKVAYDTRKKVMAAMRDGSAVVVTYTDAKGELVARVLWPLAITLTKANDITAYRYCTLRREWRSFRLSRVIACHPLTTPDDYETGESAANQ